MATISAWAVGSFVGVTRFAPSARIRPSLAMTAPKGPPPERRLSSARVMARRMNSVEAGGWVVADIGWSAISAFRACPCPQKIATHLSRTLRNCLRSDGVGDCYGSSCHHPGEHLAEELEALDMSAAELARKIDVPTNRITQIMNGTRGITGDTALRLAHFFGTSAQFWLNLQSLYDLRVAQVKIGKSIKALPTLKRRELVHA